MYYIVLYDVKQCFTVFSVVLGGAASSSPAAQRPARSSRTSAMVRARLGQVLETIRKEHDPNFPSPLSICESGSTSTVPNPMGRSRGAKIKSPWRQPCGAPPLRSWPAPVGSVPAGQPVRRAAWAAPAAIPVSGRTRSFGAKPTALCQRLFSSGLVCLPSMRAHHAERHTRSAT